MRVYNVKYRQENAHQNFEASKNIKFSRKFRKRFPDVVKEITNTLDDRPIFNRFCELYNVRMKFKLGSNVDYPFCRRSERKQCRIWYNADMVNNHQSLNILDRLKNGYLGITLGPGKETLEEAAVSLSNSLMDGSSKFYRIISNLIDKATAKGK